MSRGVRVDVSGNLSTSMRENYEHGVAEYYMKVGSTYRNPHYPGIRLCLFSWLNKWWQMDHENISSITSDEVMLFDMACDPSGEATLAFVEWVSTGKKLHQESLANKAEEEITSTPRPSILPRRKGLITPVSLGSEFPKPQIAAADPFTAVAYKERTRYPCAELSFEDIAEGLLPSVSVNIANGTVQEMKPPEHREEREIKYSVPVSIANRTVPEIKPSEGGKGETNSMIEMVVCSFALHLIEDPSGLFALLWQLSLKARWLVILAPHKKPEIKDGWGWYKWDVEAWSECQMTGSTGEFLHDRVHCRVYKSVNF